MVQATIPPGLPTSEQEQRVKWDLLLADFDLRLEQVRQMRGYEPKRLLFQGLTAFAAIFAAGGVVGGLLVRVMSGHS
jgi:hypothetical protein